MFHIVSEDVKMAVGRTWGRAWSLQHCASDERLTEGQKFWSCESCKPPAGTVILLPISHHTDLQEGDLS